MPDAPVLRTSHLTKATWLSLVPDAFVMATVIWNVFDAVTPPVTADTVLAVVRATEPATLFFALPYAVEMRATAATPAVRQKTKSYEMACTDSPAPMAPPAPIEPIL